MVKIRAARKEDLEKLAKVYVEVYRVFDVGEKWTQDSAYKLLDYWLIRQPDLAFVAEEDDSLIGAFFVGVKPWWDGNHLVEGEIFVDPAHQAQGVGKKLLKIVLGKALEKYQVTFWDTITFRRFDFPLNWYKKIGMEEVLEWVLVNGDVKSIMKSLMLR